MKHVSFVIVGAGPTGLGAAHRLRELGIGDWLLVEREETAGGLSCSVTDEHGFTWDMGGHVQFSHYATFDRYMEMALSPEEWLNHQRESWIWIANRFIPYPLQNNLHRLPSELRWRCIQGLLAVNKRRHSTDEPVHFQQWIDQTFGSGVADIFLNPYNFKVWAHPLEKMNATWVGERVSVPSMEQVLKSVCLEQDDVSWGPNRTFRFPKRGGTGSIWNSLCLKLPPDKIQFGVSVVKIDAQRRHLYLSNHDVVSYQHLISTVPLDVMTRMIDEPNLVAASKGLPYSSTHVIGIGLRGQPPPHLGTKCWMYFPEADCPFYRVTLFSNYSPNNVPEPTTTWSLMAEVSESRYKPIDPDRVIQLTIEGMLNTGLIERVEDIVSKWHRRLVYGYPVPGVDRNDALAMILPNLEKVGVFSRGRFGAWKYEVSNQDHSFSQGREVIDRLVGTACGEEGPEPTLNRPNWVNSRRNP